MKFIYALILSIAVGLNSNPIESTIQYHPEIIEQKQTIEKINDREYDWYFSQRNTGAYSDVNCGTAVIAMVLKWHDEESEETARSIRADMGHTGLTYFDEMWYYLRDKGVRVITVRSDGFDDFNENVMRVIDKGSILILLLDENILNNRSNRRIIGHYVVAYGYKKTKEDLSYFIKDPNNNRVHKIDSNTISNAVLVYVEEFVEAREREIKWK